MTKEKIVILGVDTPIGLALIREFGRNNFEVIGIGRKLSSIGHASKYLSKFFIRVTAPEILVDQLNEIGSTCQVDAIIAISEGDIELLNNNRDRLIQYKILNPQKEAMDKVLNKSTTYRYAESVGIKTPKTFHIKALSELEGIKKSINFPVVLKWSNPQEMLDTLKQKKIPFMKTEYADSFNELQKKLSRYEILNCYPMVQEYCKGKGLGQFFLVNDGRIIERYQHERIHEWPPEGGTSTCCKGLELNKHEALMAKSEQLLLALNWEGVAMVEYRYDEEKDEAMLMEINGRFWGSYPLASMAGAHFGVALYNLSVSKNFDSSFEVDYSTRCRFMFPEIKRLFRVLFEAKKIEDIYYKNTPHKDFFSFILSFLNPKSGYYVFDWRDPKPFFQDFKNAILRK